MVHRRILRPLKTSLEQIQLDVWNKMSLVTDIIIKDAKIKLYIFCGQVQ